ncbi:MAG: FecR domain-containing protein [Candidatus Hydrogenedentes bacterium]|nr:FecR domain-containing protein [Candidatus Hydrogenedentota bacterium]
MASCGQIRHIIAAYVDGECRDAERLILERHVEACNACRGELEETRALAATLFETLAPERLQHSIEPVVLAHLPQMDEPAAPMHELTQRVKHPEQRTRFLRFLSWSPAMAAAAMLLLGAMLWFAWPSESLVPPRALGMVLHEEGRPALSSDTEPERRRVSVNDTILAGYRYETGPDAGLLLGLNGPTQIKVFGDTRLRVSSERSVRLESGAAHLEVSPGERYFRVNTPNGKVTVFGTSFAVEILADVTLVTVIHGEVQVENSRAFTILRDGEQARVRADDTVLVATRADVGPLLARAERIKADPAAEKAFLAGGQPSGTPRHFKAERVFVVETQKRPLRAIHFDWKPDGRAGNRAGYDIYVSDNNLKPLFKGRIDPWVFEDGGISTHTFLVPDGPAWTNIGVLHITVMPDFATGNTETNFTEVSATAL